ncbi:shikimate kinase [Candidatus Fermentibacteria bacterium]|nr:shikimate kinase [Candidatus Fermentibacteria bacterium]
MAAAVSISPLHRPLKSISPKERPVKPPEGSSPNGPVGDIIIPRRRTTATEGKPTMIVVLAGPPISGKTTVGSILADRLGVPFVDIDDRVRDRTGLSIPEVFDRMGEESFRRMEAELLRETLLGESAVVGVGGGCLLSPTNLELAADRAVVVTLLADDDVILSRWREGDRPLAASRSDLAELLSRRREHYLSLPNPVLTNGLSPEEVAERIVGVLKGPED